MKVHVVYESLFGHTAALAESVAAGLRTEGVEVGVVRVGERDDHTLAGVDLLVLAAPTHALSLSRPDTRADAVKRGADPVVATSGLREWMADLGPSPGATPAVAVFDTRARITRRWPGSAARAAARRMRDKGYDVVQRTSFYVEDVTGPLLDGEAARAVEWGRGLVPDAAHRPSSFEPGA